MNKYINDVFSDYLPINNITATVNRIYVPYKFGIKKGFNKRSKIACNKKAKNHTITLTSQIPCNISLVASKTITKSRY